MSRPVNIYELLEEDQDATAQKGAPTKRTSQSQAKPQQQKQSAPAQGKQDNRAPRPQRARQDQVSERKEGNRPPRRGEGERRRKDEQGPRRGREFDRHDGTGRAREFKKAGGGRANWGKPEDDQKAQPAPEAEKVEQPEEQPAPAVEVEKTEEEKKAEEEEAKIKTLDEYLKGIKKPTIALPEPRREVASDFKGFVPLKREVEDSEEKKKTEKKKTESKETQQPAISADQLINFTTPPKPKRREEGFRGARGQGPRNKGRGAGKPRTPAPQLNSENFPALSTKA